MPYLCLVKEPEDDEYQTNDGDDGAHHITKNADQQADQQQNETGAQVAADASTGRGGRVVVRANRARFLHQLVHFAGHFA